MFGYNNLLLLSQQSSRNHGKIASAITSSMATIVAAVDLPTFRQPSIYISANVSVLFVSSVVIFFLSACLCATVVCCMTCSYGE